MRQTQLLSNVKMETTPEPNEEEETLLLGLQNNTTSTHFTGIGDMDVEDQLLDTDTFFSSSQMSGLDFDLLTDFPLPSQLLFEDELLCGEDSNSGSQTSTSDLGYVEPSSMSDSPPFSPPSPSLSDYGSGSSETFHPVSNYTLQERVNNRLSTSSSSSSSSSVIGGSGTNGQGTSILISTGSLTPGTPSHLNLSLSIPKSSRGRSASHDPPDVQAIKRQIRMIRNRESACLSRKKKKDYVVSLEGQVKELEEENRRLKQENSFLRLRLGESGNQLECKGLRASPHVNMLSKSRKSSTGRTIAKVALLSICCFMFVCFRSSSPSSSDKFNSLRIPNETVPPSKSMLDPIIILPLENPPLPPSHLIRSRRSFGLWAETEESGIGNGTVAGPIKDKPRVTNKSFHQSGSRRSPYGLPPSLNSFMNASTTNKCPLHFNQTEAMRVQNDLKGIFNFKKSSKKIPGMKKPLVYSLMDLGLGLGRDEKNKGLTGTGVQVYDEKIQQYSGLLDKLQRREDTFYVVSLAVDNQLLLSAKAHNESSRPKMSFLIPWKNDTLGGKEELMQIDCEVTRVSNLNNAKSHKKRSPK